MCFSLGIILGIFWRSCLSATFNVKGFGAKGDGTTLDTAAIQKAFQAASQSGGGTVLFPSDGHYLTSPFNLTSNTIMLLEKGSRLLGVEDRSKYPIIAPLPSYGQSRDVGYCRHQPLVFGVNVTNVKITGGGTIDGNGKYWWDLHKARDLKYGRPRLVETLWSKDIEISEVNLENSGFWTLHPTYSENIYIHDIRIMAPQDSPNTDGIDPDSSSNVLIERVTIDCGDDHIAIKSGMNDAGLEYNWPSRNITVRNCHFGLGNGISIGSETSGGVFDVYIHDNTVTGAEKGMYIKTGYGRGNVVENIRYENIRVEMVAIGIDINMNYGHLNGEENSSENKTKIPTVRNVSYKNIYGTAGQHGVFDCLVDSPCHGISFDDVKIVSLVEYQCQNAFGTQKDCKPKVCITSD